MKEKKKVKKPHLSAQVAAAVAAPTDLIPSKSKKKSKSVTTDPPEAPIHGTASLLTDAVASSSAAGQTFLISNPAQATVPQNFEFSLPAQSGPSVPLPSVPETALNVGSETAPSMPSDPVLGTLSVPSLEALGFKETDFPPLPSVELSHSEPSLSCTLGTSDTATSNPVPSPALAKERSYINVTMNRSSSNGLPLSHVPHPAARITIDEEDIDDTRSKFCLIGFFTKRFPGKHLFLQLCRTWPTHSYHFHKSGWIIFEFHCENDALEVLRGGPYSIFGRTLMLKQMPRFFHFDNGEFTIVPVWVQLESLPLSLWTGKAISKICSFFGKPLYTDQMTAEQKRCMFARALVEVDIANPLPDVVDIDLPNGTSIKQRILYEDIPKFCSHCSKLGHDKAACLLLHPKPSLPPLNQLNTALHTSNPVTPPAPQPSQTEPTTAGPLDPPLANQANLPAGRSEQFSGPSQPSHRPPAHHSRLAPSVATAKGKAVLVDQDGFQQVHAKKSKKKASKGTPSIDPQLLTGGSLSSPLSQ